MEQFVSTVSATLSDRDFKKFYDRFAKYKGLKRQTAATKATLLRDVKAIFNNDSLLTGFQEHLGDLTLDAIEAAKPVAGTGAGPDQAEPIDIDAPTEGDEASQPADCVAIDPTAESAAEAAPMDEDFVTVDHSDALGYKEAETPPLDSAASEEASAAAASCEPSSVAAEPAGGATDATAEPTEASEASDAAQATEATEATNATEATLVVEGSADAAAAADKTDGHDGSNETAEEATGSKAPASGSEQSASVPEGQPLVTKSLYINNLPQATTEDELRAAFSVHGEITKCSIARDPVGNSKGYAFVDFTTREACDAAIAALDGSEIHGNKMKVQISRPIKRNNVNTRGFPRGPAFNPMGRFAMPGRPFMGRFMGRPPYGNLVGSPSRGVHALMAYDQRFNRYMPLNPPPLMGQTPHMMPGFPQYPAPQAFMPQRLAPRPAPQPRNSFKPY